MILMIASSRPDFADVVTTRFVAQEVVRSAVATVGLGAAVPLTTLLAAVALRERSVGPP